MRRFGTAFTPAAAASLVLAAILVISGPPWLQSGLFRLSAASFLAICVGAAAAREAHSPFTGAWKGALAAMLVWGLAAIWYAALQGTARGVEIVEIFLDGMLSAALPGSVAALIGALCGSVNESKDGEENDG